MNFWNEIRKHKRVLIFVFILLPDTIAISTAMYIAYSSRFNFGQIESPNFDVFIEIDYKQLLSALAAGWVIVFIFSGIYVNRQSTLTILNLQKIILPTFVYFLIIGFLSFIFKASFSRIVFLLAFSVGLLLVVLLRLIIFYGVIRIFVNKKVIRTNLLVVGLTKNQIEEYSKWIYSNRNLGFFVAAKLECNEINLSWVDTFESRFRDSHAEEVLFLPGIDSKNNFSKFIHYLQDLDIHVNWIPLDSGNVGFWQIPSAQFGIPFLTFEKAELTIFQRILKRMFDLIFSCSLLILLSPVFVAIAVAILVSDGRPIIYSQERIGRAGKKFKFFKFRSMVRNAELELSKVDNNLGPQHILFKNKHDPRVTKIGRFLRKYSLDELPQFYNVLNNTMSVVGPRPALPHEVSEYDSIYERRLIAKPGITGPWQISGRSDLDLQTSVSLDLNYLTAWSMSKDLGIVIATIAAIVRPRGAY